MEDMKQGALWPKYFAENLLHLLQQHEKETFIHLFHVIFASRTHIKDVLLNENKSEFPLEGGFVSRQREEQHIVQRVYNFSSRSSERTLSGERRDRTVVGVVYVKATERVHACIFL